MSPLKMPFQHYRKRPPTPDSQLFYEITFWPGDTYAAFRARLVNGMWYYWGTKGMTTYVAVSWIDGNRAGVLIQKPSGWTSQDVNVLEIMLRHHSLDFDWDIA